MPSDGQAAEANPPVMRKHLRVFFLAWMIAFSGAVTPGPMLALVIAQVLAQGMRAAVFILAGHAAIEALFVVLISLGLAKPLKDRRFRAVLAIVGGAALAYMGIGVLLSAGQASVETNVESAKSWLALVLGGVGVSLVNPYFTGWWATVGTGQIATFGLRSRLDYLVFWIGHELGDIVWFLFVATILVLGRGWLNDTVYRTLLWVCGAAIAILAGVFLYIGTRDATRPPAS